MPLSMTSGRSPHMDLRPPPATSSSIAEDLNKKKKKKNALKLWGKGAKKPIQNDSDENASLLKKRNI